MKEIWVLSVRTSLPNKCQKPSELKTTLTAYDNFEKGRDAMRKTLLEFATSDNSMFDGKGNIIEMQKYIKTSYEFEEDEELDDEYLNGKQLTYLHDCLKAALLGKEVAFDLGTPYAEDWALSLEVSPDKVQLVGEPEGVFNGYDPYIATNIFSMNEEKDYFLYIDDMFGQDCSSELYVDLKKVVLR